VTYPKRLTEVDLPVKRISAHSRREKSIRHGHISTLHIWRTRLLVVDLFAGGGSIPLETLRVGT
jgi:adenine-specific DNA methylase